MHVTADACDLAVTRARTSLAAACRSRDFDAALHHLIALADALDGDPDLECGGDEIAFASGRDARNPLHTDASCDELEATEDGCCEADDDAGTLSPNRERSSGEVRRVARVIAELTHATLPYGRGRVALGSHHHGLRIAGRAS